MRAGATRGLGAAVVVAAVTLAVFGTFQNYGPASAVRAFHHAVGVSDAAELADAVEGPANSSAVRDLVLFVRATLRASGGNYRIVKSERSPGQVEMLALYEGRLPVIWVVVKARDRWRIDPYLTVQGLRRLGYL